MRNSISLHFFWGSLNIFSKWLQDVIFIFIKYFFLFLSNLYFFSIGCSYFLIFRSKKSYQLLCSTIFIFLQIFIFIFILFIYLFIFIQLQLSAFTPLPSTPSQPVSFSTNFYCMLTLHHELYKVLGKLLIFYFTRYLKLFLQITFNEK